MLKLGMFWDNAIIIEVIKQPHGSRPRAGLHPDEPERTDPRPPDRAGDPGELYPPTLITVTTRTLLTVIVPCDTRGPPTLTTEKYSER
jgi:hypothetical protein